MKTLLEFSFSAEVRQETGTSWSFSNRASVYASQEKRENAILDSQGVKKNTKGTRLADFSIQFRFVFSKLFIAILF